MLNYLSKKWKEWGEEGIYTPFLYDPVTKKPSSTLLFFYVSGIIALSMVLITSIMMILSGNYLTASIMPVMMNLIGFVFYRLRRLDSFKINLREQSVELDSGNDNER